MTRARLPRPAVQRKEEVVRPQAGSAKVARSARWARDPLFMRAVDRLQRTAAPAPASSDDARILRLARDQVMASTLPAQPTDTRFSGVLDVQRMAGGDGMRVSTPHDPAEQEAEAVAHAVTTMPSPEEEDALLAAGGGTAPEAPVTAGAPVARMGEGLTHASLAVMD